jgi:ribosomal-protein-alanine N-acetyltransferase
MKNGSGLSKMIKVEIVEAKLDDIDQIMVVEKLSFTIPWSKKTMQEEIFSNNMARYLVAKVNGQVVGYAGVWKILNEGHITNIAVHPEFRDCGVGSALLSELIKRGETEGIESFTLEVRKTNKAAIALYSKYGFKEAGVRKKYYADNDEDAILMWRLK